MFTRSNQKARISRAKRTNIEIPSVSDVFRRFKCFTLVLVVLFPVYPSLSFLVGGASARANDYDESTIITAYNDVGDGTDQQYISENGLVKVGDTFSGDSEVAPSPVVVEGGGVRNIIKIHVVEKGESVRSISDKYGVSSDAILWANDLSIGDDLQIGQKLKVPPVSGVVHHVVDGDTISAIAAKYKVDAADIVSVNMLKDAGSIRIGMDLMIPGAMKGKTPVAKASEKSVKEQEKDKPAVVNTEKANTKLEPPMQPQISSKTGDTKERYAIKYTGKGRGFAPGNCTWYVAQNKTVTWRGNANQWMRNAKAAGVPTGQKPVTGAIIQFSGAGYSRYYGHVGIVADVTDDYVIVKDMNYRGLYEVTIRKVPIDDDSIAGYIYVD